VSDLAPLLPLLAILVLFWLMVIRPASRRQKAVAALQDSLRAGQRVMLTSGIYGTIASLEDDRVHLEVAAGVQVEVARAAVAKVLDSATQDASPENPTTGEVDGA
jgi:preprotein translocase subunit YajC